MLLVLLCFVGEPLIAHVLGHGAERPFPFANGEALKPVGPWTHVANATSTAEALATHKNDAVRARLGRARSGATSSSACSRAARRRSRSALGSTFLALLIGVPLGALAGLLGGLTDATVSRLTEFFMGFPILLLLAALGYSVREPDRERDAAPRVRAGRAVADRC